MNLLEIHHLSKSFEAPRFSRGSAVTVLKDISLTLEEGSIMALVGESGCGKTTLGKIITGLFDKSEGEILYRGVPLEKMTRSQRREYRREVQYIQQDSYASLNPVKTIYQSLYAPIKANFRYLKREEIETKIREYLGLVGLNPPEEFLEKYPHQLSGGQRQRILIARIVSLQPALLVADEPISMIDVSLRLSILSLLNALNREFHLSILYITHDLSTVKYFVGPGEIAVMYLGEIVEKGKADEVFQNPRHPYTQALLSCVPIPDPVLERNKPAVLIKSMEMPSLSHRPEGCAFRERCLYAKACCEKAPSLQEETKGHEVRCQRNQDIPLYSYQKEPQK